MKLSYVKLQRDDKLKEHDFDKDSGFTIVTDDTAKEKIEEQLGTATQNNRPNKLSHK